ncbi:MAG TPA: methionyl-tRNA formyltransferase [Microthrixaceae bacterium]|nr:methionyl-tRNA formyltransferase [Microthrixaceae bacterium]
MTGLPVPPPTIRRVAYLGTPEVAVEPLRALAAWGVEVALVVTAADKRRGRGSALVPSPVKAAALELGLPVTDDPDELLDLEIDLGVVVAYGRLIRSHLLAAIPFVNLHFSLLPRWRGAAPVERAILAGDERTGVCLMAVEESLDTGGVYARAETDVDGKTLEELRSELVDDGIELLSTALREGFGHASPQAGEATYASKLEPEERRLDWTRPAVDLERVVRLGGAWTTLDGERFKIPAATVGGTDGGGPPGTTTGERSVVVATGAGVLELGVVQPAGRRAIAAADWWRGVHADSIVLGP